MKLLFRFNCTKGPLNSEKIAEFELKWKSYTFKVNEYNDSQENEADKRAVKSLRLEKSFFGLVGSVLIFIIRVTTYSTD
jgi:hypothetical protein